MNILHIASITDDKAKGPNINVPKNVSYGNKFANVGLYNLRNSKLAIEIPKERLFYRKSYQHISELPNPFNKPDIVIFHGVYFIEYCRIAKWLRKNNIPYIIIPRCSMTSAAIKSHALKKKTANSLFFNKFISGAKSIQFLTKNEYNESKNNFKFKNYYILGNGTELPKKHYKAKNRKEFKIVFIGRYNVYHKGLDVLLQAVKEHANWFRENNVTLELYGSNSDNGLKFLINYINKNNLENIVIIKGPAFGDKKEEALLNADVFIHTSRLEGQPTAVIEAISYGIPVIVTPGTNIADVVKKFDLGFTSELDSEAIFNCIKKAFESKKDFSDISRNEIKYSGEHFDWEKITDVALDKYSSLTRSGK